MCNQTWCIHYLLRFSSSFRNPLPGFGPTLVESEEPSLTTALDELIRLRNELGGKNPVRNFVIRSDCIRFRIPGHLGNPSGRVLELGLDRRMGCHWRCTLKPVCEQELGIVFTNGWRDSVNDKRTNRGGDRPLEDMVVTQRKMGRKE